MSYFLKHWVEILTMLGEWGIVFVIYLEIEAARFDRFFEDAFEREHWDARKNIYQAFFDQAKKNPTEFLKTLESDAKLRDDCDREIALLNKLGNNLPWFPGRRRNRVLDWFPTTAIFLWKI